MRERISRIMTKNKLARAKIIIAFVTAIFCTISFIVTPFTGDLKVFSASANQSSYISQNLIVGAYKAWELKSVFSRTLIYFIYKIATTFCDFGTYQYEMLSKACYLVIMIFIIVASMKLLFDKVEEIIFYSLLILISFTAMHTGCQMQVEMSCSLLIVLAFSLYYNAIKTEHFKIPKMFIAGLLIGATFWFKSVLILLAVSVVAAICIFNINENRQLKITRAILVAFGSIFSILINYVIISVINPDEINDILDASAFQSTLVTTGTSVGMIPHICLKFLYMSAYDSIFIPIVLVGVCSLIVNLIMNISKKQWRLVFYHFVMWAMPAIFVILSNKYFIYHYDAFIFMSLIEAYLMAQSIREDKTIWIWRLLEIGVFVWYLINFSIISTSVQRYIECDIESYREASKQLLEMNFDKSEEILYLDDGMGAYMLGGESYLKYYFPLPLQRLDDTSKLECYVKTKEEALSFEGKYISVYESWFFDGKNEDIKEKLESEYHLLGEYTVFSPPHSLGTDSVTTREYELYEKN